MSTHGHSVTGKTMSSDAQASPAGQLGRTSPRSATRVWQQDRRVFATADTRAIRVRLYRARDRAAIRRIIVSSGFRGRPTTLFFEDEAVVLKLFMDYYLAYEPESCFVAESGGRVVGYILGCKDTRRYHRVLLVRYGPQILARLLLRALGGGFRRSASYRTIWWVLTRAWREVPETDLRRFPAHLHIGVDQELHRGRGLAVYVCLMRLGDALIQHLRAAGVAGVHGQIPEPENQDYISNRVLTLYGFALIAARPFSLWTRITGEQWHLKLLELDLRRERAGLRA